MNNSTGVLFRVSTFGESHGPALGVLIDGCPSGLALDFEKIQRELDRRRPGQSDLTTQRKESDEIEVLSGLFDGLTTGTPLCLLIRNRDAKSRDYREVSSLYRPGHGDVSYELRYGIRDDRGGGRASARETVARVAAGAVARQWLSAKYGIEVLAWVDEVAGHRADLNGIEITREGVESSLVRCPSAHDAQIFEHLIREAKKAGDTLGGVISGRATGVPGGWGAPVFDKLEADLAKACLSLPACKGFEIGSGFAGTRLRGSEHNDPMTRASQLSLGHPLSAQGARLSLQASNHAGGVLAGITTGAPLVCRCAFKPVSTHFLEQETLTRDGDPIQFKNRGRHDPCVLPRAVPLIEAAMLLTLADHALRTEALWGAALAP